ncbi:MAG: histidine triad nucleotide-binding protein [Deltaproteobacteria bacterium]|nr:histidine triad nucleotide-binding protein [Deltaproteobacteria bacterium]
MEDCIFCKIIAGDIPSDKVYEDDDVYAFDDIEPQAPVHSLVVPKRHVAALNDLDDVSLWNALLRGIKEVARLKGMVDSGYRVVINCGEHGGQVVKHLHVHVLGGKRLDDKMG